MKTAVSIVRDENLERRVLRAINLLGGIGRFVKSGDIVLIKPNLVDGKDPETGETVHPEMIRILISLAQEAGAERIIVGEGATRLIPSLNSPLHRAVRRIAEEEGAEMINFEEHPFVRVRVKDPVYFSEVKVPEAFLNCDIFINVPALKTHHLVGITVAMKNLYGLLSLEDKIKYHRLDKTEEAIVDLNLVRRSDLIVVDGTYATHHLPPLKKLTLNLTIASDNAVAVDVVSAKILGMKPEKISILNLAEEHGLGPSDINQIKILGLPIEKAFRWKAPTVIDVVNHIYEGKIRLINGDACSRCFGRLGTELYRNYEIDHLKKPLYILLGPEANPPEDGDVIFCGDCLKSKYEGERRGIFVSGCPPAIEDFRRALAKFNVRSRGASFRHQIIQMYQEGPVA